MVEYAASSSPSEYEVEDDDLLCSTSAQTHDGQNGLVSRASLVYLRLESATALETKVINTQQFRVARSDEAFCGSSYITNAGSPETWLAVADCEGRGVLRDFGVLPHSCGSGGAQDSI